MPIASGQLGLLLITGVADGLLGEGDTLHAVRGSENVFLKLHSRNWKQQRKKLYYKNAARNLSSQHQLVKSKNLSRKGRDMSVLLGIGALYIVWEFSNRIFRIAIVLTVICLCASQLGAGTYLEVLEQFSVFQGAGDMLHAAEQSLPEWKRFIDFNQ